MMSSMSSMSRMDVFSDYQKHIDDYEKGERTTPPGTPVIAAVPVKLIGTKRDIQIDTRKVLMSRQNADEFGFVVLPFGRAPAPPSLEAGVTVPQASAKKSLPASNDAGAIDQFVRSASNVTLIPAAWSVPRGPQRKLVSWYCRTPLDFFVDVLANVPVARSILTEPSKNHRNPPPAKTRLHRAFKIVDLAGFNFLPVTDEPEVSKWAIRSTYRGDKAIVVQPSVTTRIDISLFECPVACDLLKYFDDTSSREIHVYLPEIHPSLVRQDWFRYLASGLLAHRTKPNIYVQGDRAAHTDRVLDGHIDVSALTATAIVMRAYGDIHAFAYVVSLAPGSITEEFRKNRMGAAIGTHATKALIASIFNALSKNEFRGAAGDDVLMNAATNLLATHIARDDHHSFINKPAKTSVETLRHLFEPMTESSVKNLKGYARMAGVRDGIIFGALYRYDFGLKERTQHHIDVLNVVVQAASSAIIQGLRSVPVAGASVSEAAGTLLHAVSSGAMLRVSSKLPSLKPEIERIFEIGIARPAENGIMPGLENSIDPDISKAYVADASRIMEALRPK
jgi:hypothetical protein